MPPSTGLSALPHATSITTDITSVSSFSRWQHDLVLYGLAVAALALGAGFVFALTTRNEVSKKYRPSSTASALICGVAFLSYVLIVTSWLTGFRPTDAVGSSWVPKKGTILSEYRYADWSVTVPLLTAELLAVCSLTRTKALWSRASTMAASFLMILTGYLGVIGVGQASASRTGALVWGAISTVFYVYLYVALLGAVRSTLPQVSRETGTSLRNAAVLLLSVWGAYPLVYLVGVFAGPGSAGWALTVQLTLCAADVVAKVGFGSLVHKVAKLRTAEDALLPEAAVPDVYPAEVYVSGSLLSRPAVDDGQAPVTARA